MHLNKFMQCHNPSLHHTNNATKAPPLMYTENAYDSTLGLNVQKKNIKK